MTELGQVLVQHKLLQCHQAYSFQGFVWKRSLYPRASRYLSSIVDVIKLLAERNQMVDELKEHLLQAQNWMKVQANQHRREVVCETGFIWRFSHISLSLRLKEWMRSWNLDFMGLMRLWKELVKWLIDFNYQKAGNLHPTFHISKLEIHFTYYEPTFANLTFNQLQSLTTALHARISLNCSSNGRINHCLQASRSPWTLYKPIFLHFKLGTRWITRKGVLIAPISD